MTAITQKVTAEDLLQMPDDGLRYELVRGELKKTALAGSEHGRIAVRFSWRLAQHVEANNLGVAYAAETGFLLSTDPDTVRAPDVAFVRQQRLEEVGEVKGYWSGAPDMAVEVISPNDHYAEVEEKVSDWLEAGTRMVVVVNPRRHTVTVYRSLSDIRMLNEDEVLEGGDVVPGWEVRVKDLFA